MFTMYNLQDLGKTQNFSLRLRLQLSGNFLASPVGIWARSLLTKSRNALLSKFSLASLCSSSQKDVPQQAARPQPRRWPDGDSRAFDAVPRDRAGCRMPAGAPACLSRLPLPPAFLHLLPQQPAAHRRPLFLSMQAPAPSCRHDLPSRPHAAGRHCGVPLRAGADLSRH